MESFGEGVRRSIRLVNIRRAEEEAEKYIIIPGKGRFKKDSRTWLHKSSKKIKPKATDVPPEAKGSPAKGVKLVRRLEPDLKTAGETGGKLLDGAFTADVITSVKKSHRDTKEESGVTNEALSKPAADGKSVKKTARSGAAIPCVWSDHSRQAELNAKSIDTTLSQSAERQLNVMEKQNELKRNLTEINTTLLQKVQIRCEDTVLSDSELCLRAYKLALGGPKETGNNPREGPSSTGQSKGSGKQKHKSKPSHNKTVGKKDHLALSEKKYKSGPKTKSTTSKSSIQSSKSGSKNIRKVKPCVPKKTSPKQDRKPKSGSKTLVCGRQLAKKARKQLKIRSPLKKTPLKLFKKAQRKVDPQTPLRQKKESQTSLSSHMRGSKTNTGPASRLVKRVSKTAEGDTIDDLRITQRTELSINSLHSFSSLDYTPSFLSDHHLRGDVSDKSILVRSASEAAVNPHTDAYEHFLQLQQDCKPVSPLRGKASRSAERIFSRSPTRKLSEDDTRVRKRKGSAEDRSKLSGKKSASVTQKKRSRDSVTDDYLSRQDSSITFETAFTRLTTLKTMSGSELSLQVQCSNTVDDLMADTESCPSSTVVEQGSFSSFAISSRKGRISSPPGISDESMDDDSSYNPFLSDEHFHLAPSPGSHNLETINLEDFDLTLETDIAASAHELHRAKNLLFSASVITEDDHWVLASNSEASTS